MSLAPAAPPVVAPIAAPVAARSEAPSAACTPRVAGLDTLRALAIALVLAYHHQVFVSRQPDLGWFSSLGWTGVDLFFVLSGYLIGDQILGPLQRGQGLPLWRFYGRRLLRTLPAFWVVLALYFSFPAEMGGREPPPLWRFLSFTQNIGLQPGTAFSHAWSLCVEEQFYLLLPLVALAGQRWLRSARWGWALWLAALATGMALRSWLWTRHGLEAGPDPAGYHPNLYYASWCRADEFLPGVAVAMLKHWHPQAWQRLMQQGQALLLAGLLAVGVMGWAAHEHYYINGYGYGFFMTAFGYSLIALAFSLLLLAALSPRSALHGWRVPGAAALAAWSYSIYLSHKAIGHIVNQALLGQGLPAASWQTLLAAMAASLLGGWLLYASVEAPALRWRQRWLPARPPLQPAHATPP